MSQTIKDLIIEIIFIIILEIKIESGVHMHKGWWIFGVTVLTIIAFYIPGQAGYLWSPITCAMGIVGLYFTGLVIYILKMGRSTVDRDVGIGALALLGALTIYSGLFNYDMAEWQHQNLMDIRKTIDKGVSLAHTQEPLLHSLSRFHKQGNKSDSTVTQIFRARYGGQIETINGEMRFVPKQLADVHEESPLFFLKEIGRDSVIIIAQSLQVRGRDPSFQNYDGGKGKMQYRAILTEGGVNYEREN
ncbi:hypothetical protein NC796_09250 [Aliifodinibius sp. S!AR15-10]|uniref:hypothetical protein n=1 Tax=Aliifodinibius sp. S!AR15-10 TaxID=2950437 RepID=UPI0028633DFC|nr:hypothetical protein [Aliifodinibius sp. S!AR15-10]MDR8391322.1 hypothetical protein [Aliifodinibius sp. S!AR15-10]